MHGSGESICRTLNSTEHTTFRNMDLSQEVEGLLCDDCGLIFCDYRHFLLHRKCHNSLLRGVIAEETLAEGSCPLCFVKHIEKFEVFRLGSVGRYKEYEQKIQAKQVVRCSQEVEGLPCDDCGLVFSDYRHLLLHRKCHNSLLRRVITDETLAEGSCPLCFVKHFEKFELFRLGSVGRYKEYEQETQAKQVMRCKYYPSCTKEFYRSSEFTRHVKQVHNDNTPYACQQCNYNTPRYPEFQRHIFSHVGYKMFKCHLCSKEYTTKRMLNYHLFFAHKVGNRKSFDCSHCGKKYALPLSLKLHLKTHFPDSETFKCHLCPKEYTKKDSLYYHLKTHCKRYKCHLCMNKFTTKLRLNAHFLSIHSEVNIKSHDCSICGKKYPESYQLKSHLEKHRPTAGTFKCHLCPKEYANNYNLECHLRTHYKMFKCHLCPREYASKLGLNCHLLSNHSDANIKSYDCSYCDKKFAGRSLLKVHLRKHHISETALKVFKCHICSRELCSKRTLQDHLERHSNPPKNFICRVCSKQYNSKYSLQRHELLHTGNKPFSCDYCDKRFPDSAEFKMHLSVHLDAQTMQNKQTYDCKNCGHQFMEEILLKNHIDADKESNNILFCKKCPKTFKTLNCLIYHQLSHKEFLCKVCKKKCFTSRGLRKHLKSHSITADTDSCSKASI